MKEEEELARAIWEYRRKYCKTRKSCDCCKLCVTIGDVTSACTLLTIIRWILRGELE